MKARAFWGAACAFLSLTMCSCSAGKLPFGTEKATDFDTSYAVTADITCGELEAKADITRKAANEWEFCFTEPKELMGICLTLDESGITAKLGALSVSAEPTGVYSALPEIIASAVDKLPNVAQESMTEQDGVLTAQTEFNGQRVIITAANDTGELISLKCPYYKLAVHFSNQTATPFSTEEIAIIEE